MKKSKLSLVLAFAVIFTLITPFTTYAEKADANEPVTTSETADEAVTTSEDKDTENSDDATTEDEATTEDGTHSHETEEPQEVKGNYFESGTDFVFDKMVDGNAFLIGNKITINGKVNGDLYIMATDVILEKEGQIFGNVFMLAENFTQTGLVYGLYAALTNYTCEYDGMTAFDLKVFADNIKYSGYIERTAYFSADNIELTDDAYILGNVVYNSVNEPIKGENAAIYGEIIKDNSFSIATAEIDTSNIIIDYIMTAVTLLATVLGALFIMNFFKPQALRTEIKFGFLKILKALGVGLLSIITLSIIIALLMVSGVFLEIGLIILLGLIIAAILSSTVVILTIATMLFNKFNKNKSKLFAVLYTILVTLVYFGLTIIPIAGFFISLLVNMTGFGLIVLWILRCRKNNILIAGETVEKATEEVVEDNKQEQNNEEAIKDENGKKKIKKEVIIAIIAGVIFMGFLLYPVVSLVISSTSSLNKTLEDANNYLSQEPTLDIIVENTTE